MTDDQRETCECVMHQFLLLGSGFEAASRYEEKGGMRLGKVEEVEGGRN